jgi:hypothetical protein
LITTTGSLTRAENKSVAGSVSGSGVLTKATTNQGTGSILETGTLTQQTQKDIAGEITGTGSLTPSRVFYLSSTGTISLTASITKFVTKVLSAEIFPFSTLDFFLDTSLIGGTWREWRRGIVWQETSMG